MREKEKEMSKAGEIARKARFKKLPKITLRRKPHPPHRGRQKRINYCDASPREGKVCLNKIPQDRRAGGGSRYRVKKG